MNDDNILVIVPPRPEYAHEFSYSNLYEDDVDAGEYFATLPPIESHVVSPTAVMASTKTLSSGQLTSLASLSSSSFDSSNVNIISDGRSYKAASSSIITRDPRNGAFTFQVHAEYDMLLRVQKVLTSIAIVAGIARTVAVTIQAKSVTPQMTMSQLRRAYVSHDGLCLALTITAYMNNGCTILAMRRAKHCHDS